VILPHFLKHYDFVDRIVVYDNQSDDESLQILKSSAKVEVRSFDTGGKHHTGKLDKIRNQAWKESKGQADFVIVCDIDEFLYHPHFLYLLEAMKACGATVMKPQGYEMLGEQPPESGDDIFELYSKGMRTYSFDKCVLFDPDAIEEINYQPGSHTCEPAGEVVLFRRPELTLLHFRHLGVSYVRHRYEASVARRSDFNLKHHFGTHYLESEEDTQRRFEKMRQNAVELTIDKRLKHEKGNLQARPNQFDEQLESATAASANQDWATAVAELEYILSYDPGHVEALKKLSVALSNVDRKMDAGYALKQALALDSERPDLWFSLGEIATELGSEKVSIHSYQEAIRLDQNFPLAHLKLADALQLFGQPMKAGQHYRKAIQLKPTMSDAYRRFGQMLCRLKQYQGAVRVYEAWLQAGEDKASALNGMGLVLKALGRTEEALEKMKQALDCDPSSVAVLNNLATMLHLTGRAEESVGYFRQALKLEPANAMLKTNLANALFELGRVDEASALNPSLVDGKKGAE